MFLECYQDKKCKAVSAKFSNWEAVGLFRPQVDMGAGGFIGHGVAGDYGVLLGITKMEVEENSWHITQYPLFAETSC